MKSDSAKILAVIVVLLPSPGMAAEQIMGRLFFTPAQRAKMDVARQQERSIRFDLEQQEEDAPPPANITLNGVISRSDGKTTLWVNNRIQNEASPVTTVGKRGEIRVVTPEAGRAVPLKVGQSVDMSSGRVDEAYRRPSHGETPSASSRGVPPPVPPRRQDDVLEASTDVQGGTLPSR